MKVGQKEFYRKLNLDTRRKRPSFQLAATSSAADVLVFFSAAPGGGRIFGLQALFEVAKQNPVAFVLLVFPSVELPLDLEAAVHHKGSAQHGEPVSGHVELTGLEGD